MKDYKSNATQYKTRQFTIQHNTIQTIQDKTIHNTLGVERELCIKGIKVTPPSLLNKRQYNTNNTKQYNTNNTIQDNTQYKQYKTIQYKTR